MMIKFSDRAKKHLDEYLEQMRFCLEGYAKVDANEVEQNILEHIEAELGSATGPISFEELDAVLKKLGSPTQWIPDEELSWWQKMLLTLRTSPKNWRLAYVSFALFVAGFLLGGFFVVLIPTSFIISRAALLTTKEGIESKPPKWLIYPPLIVVYVFISFCLLAWPIILLYAVADGLRYWEQPYTVWLDIFKDATYASHKYYIAWLFLISSVLGLWWSILAIFILKWQIAVQTVFRPFADSLPRKKVISFLFIGLILMPIGVIAIISFHFMCSG